MAGSNGVQSQRGPDRSIDFPGSAFGVDVSADGQYVVGGSKAVHANQFGSGGRIELIQLQATPTPTPTPTPTLQLHLHLRPQLPQDLLRHHGLVQLRGLAPDPQPNHRPTRCVAIENRRFEFHKSR